MRKVASMQDAKARFYKFVCFRNKFCVCLSLVILVCYYGFVASVGFFPEVLGYRIGPSSITLGILLGLSIIVISIASTGIYTLFANKYFDKEQAEIIEDLQESGALESMITGDTYNDTPSNDTINNNMQGNSKATPSNDRGKNPREIQNLNNNSAKNTTKGGKK